jgi:transcriptional regulator with XRE-family HTH domain
MTIKDVPRTDFPARLRQWREANGLTQYALSKLLRVTPSAIYKLEADARQPYWRVVVAICAVLGCMPNDLLGENDLRRLEEARLERNARQPAPKAGRPRKKS